MLHKLQNADLDKIRRQFPHYPYHDLLRAIQVSVDDLEPDLQARYIDFAVFPKDTPIPESVLQTFWESEGLDEYDSQDVAEFLVDRSLARRNDEGRLSLHNLQYDYVRKQVGGLPDLHNRLLESYRQKCPDGWHTGPNDGYFFQHLAHHLTEAKRKDELRDLLFDHRWMQAKLEAAGVPSLIADYDFLSADFDQVLVRDAIWLSSHVISVDKAQLASQMMGRLMALPSPSIQTMLDQIGRCKTEPWIRPLSQSLMPPGSPLLCTLKEHSVIRAVAVMPDGRRAVSASRDRTLKVWDLETGEVLRTLEGHSGVVMAVAVTPDSRQAISASGDRTLKVWDIETGEVLRTLEGHSDMVRAVAVTPDGRQTVSASGDRPLKVWDIETGEVLRTLEGHSDMVRAVAVTPNDGHQAISASGDRTLKVWDIETGEVLRTLEGHSGVVMAVAVTPNDGHRVVSTSSDCTLKVWDIETGEVLRTLEGHSGWVRGVAVMPGGYRAVSASNDHTLKVWDIEIGKVLRTLEGHSDWVRAVAVMPDGCRAVSASRDRTLKVWDIETGEVLRTLEGHSDWVRAVAVMPDGRRIVSASRDHTLKVWDTKNYGNIIAGFTGESPIMSCAVASDGRTIVTGESSGRVHFLRLEGNYNKSWCAATAGKIAEVKGYLSRIKHALSSLLYKKLYN